MIFCARATRGRGLPSLGLMAHLGKSIAKQSEGRAGERYLPVGGRVRKLRAVEDQSAPSLRDNERAWRNHLYGQWSLDGRSGGQFRPPPKDGGRKVEERDRHHRRRRSQSLDLRLPVSLCVGTLSRRTFMNHAGSASPKIISHLVNRAHKRAGGSPQPTTSLPCESEQYPVAAMSRQQDEVHTLRPAEN